MCPARTTFAPLTFTDPVESASAFSCMTHFVDGPNCAVEPLDCSTAADSDAVSTTSPEKTLEDRTSDLPFNLTLPLAIAIAESPQDPNSGKRTASQRKHLTNRSIAPPKSPGSSTLGVRRLREQGQAIRNQYSLPKTVRAGILSRPVLQLASYVDGCYLAVPSAKLCEAFATRVLHTPMAKGLPSREPSPMSARECRFASSLTPKRRCSSLRKSP